MKQKVNIAWFRRDLRLHDNAMLYYALRSSNPILPIFIFDKNILNKLEDKDDARVSFIHQTLIELQQELSRAFSSIKVFFDTPLNAFKHITETYDVESVYTNHDYEHYAIDRDKEIKNFLQSKSIAFHTYKDQVIFEKNEVLKDDGTPYTVFTPYSKKWKATLNPFYIQPYPTEKYFSNFLKVELNEIPSLESIGFIKSDITPPPKTMKKHLIQHYSNDRDYPAKNGTSKMGVHLRFGTISIRQLVATALSLNETFLNELIWRDFYHTILWHFPHINHGKSFKTQYDFIQWENNELYFEKWCQGKTGFPIVDAGMRELNAIGYMHNRVRMITASFLTKHLLIDWRWGEAYFAKKLLDFDFAANNGGWQWASGSGCDAAPYFRVFNPALQTQKFDKNLDYVNKWLPELNSLDYSQPIVNHETARKKAIEMYSKFLNIKT